MGKIFNGIVVEDDLFSEYHKFRNGSVCDTKKIKQLLHFFKNEIVSNIRQYEDNGVALESNLKTQMSHAGLKRQSLEDLAENCTLYKVILSTSKNTFPYINIMEDNQRLESNFSASFDMSESRTFALNHLTAICLHAKKIVVYDKFFSQKKSNINLLESILPKKNIEITCNNEIEDADIEELKRRCNMWTFTKDPHMKNRHDRYLIVDDRLEIILSSGFDHLGNTSSDFTYLLRPIQRSRF